jgi:hypothetical protein
MNPLFRKLSSEEEAEFKKWAKDNYKPLQPIEGIWHPIVQEECAKINKGNQALRESGPIGPILHDMVKEIFNKP